MAEDIRKASLAELRKMTDRGDVRRGDPAEEVGHLPAAFWANAELVQTPATKSVHLKLDPEVFEYFKAGGKGHLTRMQKVLSAYVRAKKRDSAA